MLIESLEGRIQCDATYSAATQELIVTGTGGNDTLRVFLNGSRRIDVMQGSTNISIRRSATSTSADVGIGEVRGIIIRGLGGNDTLENALPVDVRITTRLEGSTGNDNLFGGYGNDDFLGGPDTDTANYSRRTNPLYSVTVDIDDRADDGSQKLFEQDNVKPDVENLTGTSHADKLVANSAKNVLDGGPGDDFIQGYDRNDRGIVIPGSSAGADTFKGGDGNDVIDARADLNEERTTFSKLIQGGNGNDRLYGGGGNDRIEGGAGDDWMRGSEGNDYLDGGEGNETRGDTVNYGDRPAVDPRTTGVQVSIDNVDNDGEIGTAERDNVRTSIENIEGSGNADVLIGSDERNLIFGDSGRDLIVGRNGVDVLVGGFDNDTIIGGFRDAPGVFRSDGVVDQVFGDGDLVIVNGLRNEFRVVATLADPFGPDPFSNTDRARREGTGATADVLRNIEQTF